MLTRLLAHFSEVYSRTRESFEEADVLRLLQLASKLAAAGYKTAAFGKVRFPQPQHLLYGLRS